MQVVDLEYWPPSVWVSAGSTGFQPNFSTAVITDVKLSQEKFLALAVDDQGGEYTTTIGPYDQKLARKLSLILKEAIGKTLEEAGSLAVTTGWQ